MKSKRGKAQSFWEREYARPTHLAMSDTPSADLLEFMRWSDRQKDELDRVVDTPRVLDIGCGNGRNAVYMEEVSAATVWGFDISQEAIHQAHKKSLAIILTNEDPSRYKQAVRDGSMHINKLPLSKTGTYKEGVVIERVDILLVTQCIADSTIAHTKDTPAIIKEIFPKRKKKPTLNKRISTSIDNLSIDRYTTKNSTHATQLQLFVDEARTYFGEKARFGVGSFSYYLGICKKIPLIDLWSLYGEVKQARGKTRFEQKKLFWWKVGQYIKNRK